MLTMATCTDFIEDDNLGKLFCEPCEKDGKQIKAMGFCVDCAEYLCENCYKYHRLLKVFESHTLQEKDKMPKDPIKAKIKDVCLTKCYVHADKVIEYCCGSCDLLGCHVCMIFNHRNCQNIDYISDLANELYESTEFKEFTKMLEEKSKQLDSNKTTIESNSDTRLTMKKQAKAMLKKQQDEINKFFDNLEEEMDTTIEDMDKQNEGALHAATKRNAYLTAELETMKTDVHTKETNGQKCELLICMKLYKQTMQRLESEYEKLQPESKIKRYKLIPSIESMDIVKSSMKICNMATVKSAKFVSQIDLRTSTEKNSPCITGLVEVHDHFIVTADQSNCSVKAVDIRNHNVTSEVKMESENYNVTYVGGNLIAVTTCNNKIQFLSLSESGLLSMEKQSEIAIKGESCFDLVHTKGTLIVAQHSQVQILDTRGKCVKIIPNDLTEENRFVSAIGIALSPDHETMYVSDRGKDTITIMTIDGKIKAICKDVTIKTPDGITVDNEGNVYVSSTGSCAIQQLSNNCLYIQTLVENIYSLSITFSRTSNKLYVSTDGFIQIYEVT